MTLASALLLFISFPNFNQSWCAWVALVPWLRLLRGCPVRAAFWWSYLVGVLFFLSSMWWLIHVTSAGWLILCAYLALYFALFGWLVSRMQDAGSRMQGLVVIPAVWVALEYLRSHLLSGLGWNLLAYSQTPWPALIQIADVTGAWGVSYLVVLVNVAVANLLVKGSPPGRVVGHSVIAVACALLAAGYGAWRIPRLGSPQTVRVSVVQGNIPQEEKWDEAHRQEILARYAALTDIAAQTIPSLIVWPETSVPGYVGVDEALTQQLMALARRVNYPLLLGAPVPAIDQGRVVLKNSAVLVSASGELGPRYDKLHLVPFGEFVPGERLLPWLRTLLPPIGEFSPGHEYTVFTGQGRGAGGVGRGNLETPPPPVSRPLPPFSVLICFEDIFPGLARAFVRHGAQMLIVITNDAWFGPTSAASQHTQASMFRAVELRVPIVRAANTGWSGCLDAAGRPIGSVRDPRGKELFVEGTHTCDLPLGPGNSVYRRWGDWFAGLCLLVTVIWNLLSSKGLWSLTLLKCRRII